MPAKPQPQQQRRHPIDAMGDIIANLIKLCGLYLVMREVAVEPEIRQAVLAVAAAMMLGAQALQSFLGSFFGGGK